jgi:hypothetical protein
MELLPVLHCRMVRRLPFRSMLDAAVIKPLGLTAGKTGDRIGEFRPTNLIDVILAVRLTLRLPTLFIFPPEGFVEFRHVDDEAK